MPKNFKPHYRVSLIGEIRTNGGSKVDIFSYGLSLGNPGGLMGIDGTAQAISDAIVVAAENFHSADFISAQAHLTDVKVAPINAAGSYVLGEVPGVNVVDIAGGAAGSYPYPFTTSLALTMRTRQATGKGSGRMYVPLYDSGFINGRLQAAATNDAVAVTTTFLNAVNTAVAAVAGVPANTRVCVARADGKHVVAANLPVVQVACGDVPDYIGSRRNKMVETYNGGSALA